MECATPCKHEHCVIKALICNEHKSAHFVSDAERERNSGTS